MSLHLMLDDDNEEDGIYSEIEDKDKRSLPHLYNAFENILIEKGFTNEDINLYYMNSFAFNKKN